jgi:FHS family glucose/mannose:H+ symporter-like MFS transporter
MIILFCYISLICFSFIDNARGPIYPSILDSFGLSPFQGSFYFTISSISALITTLFAHRWLKVIRTFDALKYSQLLLVSGCVLMGLSQYLFKSSTPLFLGSLVFGFGVGGTTICMNLLVTDLAPLKYRRTLTSGLHSVYAISSFLAPFLISYLLVQYTWEYYFLYICIFPLLLAVGMFFYPREKVPPITIEESSSTEDVSSKVKFFFGSFLALNVIAEVCLSSRIVFYLTSSQEWTQANANKALSYFFLALFVGRFFGAFLPKTIPIKLALLTAVLTSLGFSILGLYYHPYFLSAVGCSIAIIFPFTITWISEEFPKRRQLVITSALNYVGLFLIGMHFIFGSITNSLGISKAINLPWIALTLSLGAFFFCHRLTDESKAEKA